MSQLRVLPGALPNTELKVRGEFGHPSRSPHIHGRHPVLGIHACHHPCRLGGQIPTRKGAGYLQTRGATWIART